MQEDNQTKVDRMHQSGHTLLKICVAVLGVVSPLLMTALGWMALTLIEVARTTSVVENQLEVFVDEVAYLREELKEATRSRYTAEQAGNDRKLIEMKIEMLHGRLDSTNERLETLKLKGS